jgi:DNA-binding NtrC family response regulator
MLDVLIVDDEKNFLRDLAEGLRLQATNLYIITTDSAEKALEILNTARVDVVITDLKMPGMGGVSFVLQMRGLHRRIPIVIMSACDRAAVGNQLKNLEYAAYLEKPVDLQEVTSTILRAVNPTSSPLNTKEPARDVHRGKHPAG